MLEVSGLSVSYGQHRALENAALKVSRGEIVVILGANGAGKSTLLKAVAGICEGRVSGQVRLSGQDLIGEKPDRVVEAGLALVPEGRGVFGDLSVQENLTLGAYSRRARDDEAGNLARVLSLFPKLAERRRQIVRTMSGGEQQMVAIGRAMMSNPEILALDEPSLGLSPLLSKDLFQSLLVVKKAGLGVLLVEQNAKQSLRIADRGYLIENGAIVHEDTAAALSRDPAVQKAYLGGASAQIAPHVPAHPPRPATPALAAPPPRPASGPSPRDIAAAALKGLAQPARSVSPPPAAQTRPVAPPPAIPAPRQSAAPKPAPQAIPAPAALNVNDLVARASAQASRRTNAPAPLPRVPRPLSAPPRPASPAIPDLATSADRLRTILDEIEAAARRAETYRSGQDRS